jgi:hypothetical protein
LSRSTTQLMRCVSGSASCSPVSLLLCSKAAAAAAVLGQDSVHRPSNSTSVYKSVVGCCASTQKVATGANGKRQEQHCATPLSKELS